MDRDRRLKRIEIDPTFIESLLKNGVKIHSNNDIFEIKTGLPEDSIIIGTHYDIDRHIFSFVFNSPTFKKVKDGEIIPFLPVYVKKL
uniref:Uncharacterized protein n=1 Tax=viral metagenome TaxID=1070528 RepID=A0A6M3KLM8_9ZZZZ